MRKGRLTTPVAEIAQCYSESVSFDWRLYRYDIAGSIAHAGALAQAGIITADERQKIENELREIENEIESGKFQSRQLPKEDFRDEAFAATGVEKRRRRQIRYFRDDHAMKPIDQPSLNRICVRVLEVVAGIESVD